MKKKPDRIDITVTPKGAIVDAPTAAGVDRIRFRADVEQSGKTVERTVLAQGSGAKAIAGLIVAGQPITLRGVYARMPVDKPKPANDGKRKLGAEYIAVVGLPLDKAA